MPRARRRRTAEQAEAEILGAAAGFLAERPFRELEVGALMDRLGFTRSSFYHYFRDRHDLVVRLVEKLGRELSPMNERWFGDAEDPAAGLRAGYAEVARFWSEHGRVLRAIADAATHDPDVERAHRRLVAPIVRGTAERIRADVASGRTEPLDADLTAAALVAMSESFLNETLARSRPGDWKRVAGVLATIWERTLYGRRGG